MLTWIRRRRVLGAVFLVAGPLCIGVSLSRAAMLPSGAVTAQTRMLTVTQNFSGPASTRTVPAEGQVVSATNKTIILYIPRFVVHTRDKRVIVYRARFIVRKRPKRLPFEPPVNLVAGIVAPPAPITVSVPVTIPGPTTTVVSTQTVPVPTTVTTETTVTVTATLPLSTTQPDP